MRQMKDNRRPGRVRAVPSSALALIATFAFAACAPQDGDGRLTVRSLEVRATSADGMVIEGGAIDSTWTIPGDDARQLTRSLVLEPGDRSEAPNRLVDLALGALVAGFDFDPPSGLPEDIQITEDDANGLLEISLQQGITFRATIIADYTRDEDLAWRGTGEFGDYTVWIDGTVTPADTLRLDLAGEYEDVRERDGGQDATLFGQGILRVATGGEYTVEVRESIETTAVSAASVARRFGDAGGEVVRR